MKKISLLAATCFTFTACTYNISMAHTEGTATDVVDTTQTARAKVDPTINVPVSSPSSGQSVVPVLPEPKPAQ